MRPAACAVWLAVVVLHAAPGAAFGLLRVDENPCGTARNLHWPDGSAQVTRRFLQPVTLQGLVSDAMSRWNESVSRFRFLTGDGDLCDRGDGVVTAELSDTTCDGSALGDLLGLTTFRFNQETGEMLDAEVTLNAGMPLLVEDDALFREVVMHELGHVIGLDHSDACGQSGAGTLMKTAIIFNAPRLAAPQRDDIDGAEFIYPPSGTVDVPKGANSCAVVRPSPGAFPLAPFLGALALAVLRRVAGDCAARG